MRAEPYDPAALDQAMAESRELREPVVTIVEQALGEVVDLGLRRLAPREHAEVDADVPVVVDERDLGEFGHGPGVFPAGRGF